MSFNKAINLHHFSCEQLLAIASFFADWDGTCLLYSGTSLDSAQTSYLALFPFETLTIYGKRVSHCQGQTQKTWDVDDPWKAFQDFFPNQANLNDAFGFLGYEMGAFADTDVQLPYQTAMTPDAYWQRCAIVVKFEHKTCQASVTFAEQAFSLLSPAEQSWMERLLKEQEWLNLARQAIQNRPVKNPKEPLSFLDYPDRKKDYLRKIEIVKEYIRAGDIYQVNISQPFLFKGKRHPFEVFEQMTSLNPAPFSAYFRVNEQLSIVSTSPERFLKRQGSRLETRPIKGTIGRGATPEEDLAQKNRLLYSPKERAELLMITDLMRNDLGKMSRVGSVKTSEIWRCEAYTNVFHLLSVIKSQSDLPTIDIMRSCFPGGSITGCPKLRAMEIIAEIEQRPRGIYTGAIGYISGNGDFDLNIAIRTLIFHPNLIYLQLGGGIVIDSDPEQEYQETLLKGESLFKVLNADV